MSLFAELQRRNVVRVVLAYLAGAWLLIQIADTVFPAYGAPDSALTILITLLVIGLIPAVVISWAFELTPEGLKRDSQVVPDESTAPRTARRLDRIIMIVLALAIGFFAFDKFVIDPARDAALEQEAEERGRAEAFLESYGNNSIAVLPFVDMSPDGDQAYLSDGVAEEILNLLAKLRDLRVISRSSAFRYRGDVHIPTVAEELNVSYVLEGSLRMAGDALRITAQLIDARSDTHVWSETYDRRLDDVFAIQDEIAQAIVDELHIRLSGGVPRSRQTDPETYALYLQAKHIVDTLQHRVDEAEALLQQALDRDPYYLPALILIVKATYWIAGEDEGSRYTHEQGATLIRGYVDRALAIDPTDSAALAHRSWMAFLYRNDLETAADYINRALQYDPANEWALYVAMVISLRIGRNEAAIDFAKAGLARDPLCSGCLYNLMKAAFRSGRYEEALTASERRMRVATGGKISRGDIYLFQGDAGKALEFYDKQQEDRVGWLRSRVLAFHALQEFDKRDDALSQLLVSQEAGACREIAEAHAWLGNVDQAFACLDLYLDPRHPAYVDRATSIVWDPFLENLHDDPRWSELRENAGLDEERLSKIRIEMP